jgi:hypothetical protein
MGVTMGTLLSRGLPSAGIYVGPLAWFVSTVANYAFVPWICAHKIRVIPIVALLLIGASLVGAYLSWRGYAAASEAAPSPDPTGAGRPHRLVATIGVVTALLFAVVIAVHGAAGLTFSGCER